MTLQLLPHHQATGHFMRPSLHLPPILDWNVIMRHMTVVLWKQVASHGKEWGGTWDVDTHQNEGHFCVHLIEQQKVEAPPQCLWSRRGCVRHIPGQPHPPWEENPNDEHFLHRTRERIAAEWGRHVYLLCGYATHPNRCVSFSFQILGIQKASCSWNMRVGQEEIN